MTAGDLANYCIVGGHRPPLQRESPTSCTFCAKPGEPCYLLALALPQVWISFVLTRRRLYSFEPKITTACVMGRRPVAFQKLNINNAIKSACRALSGSCSA